MRVPGGATRINERTNAGRPVAGFRVHKGGRSLGSWRSNRAKGVLKLLIVHQGRQVPKDLLIEAFWPGYPVRAASNSLRVAIHELRQRLDLLHDGPSPPKYVLSQGKNYFINMEAAIWVDVDEFEALWRAGRSLERSGRLDEAVDTYRRAEALYTGDFLEEDPYEDWASLRREALLDVYLSILSKVVAHHMKAGDYETCIEYSQKLLAKDRCRRRLPVPDHVPHEAGTAQPSHPVVLGLRGDPPAGAGLPGQPRDRGTLPPDGPRERRLAVKGGEKLGHGAEQKCTTQA